MFTVAHWSLRKHCCDVLLSSLPLWVLGGWSVLGSCHWRTCSIHIHYICLSVTRSIQMVLKRTTLVFRYRRCRSLFQLRYKHLFYCYQYWYCWFCNWQVLLHIWLPLLASTLSTTMATVTFVTAITIHYYFCWFCHCYRYVFHHCYRYKRYYCWYCLLLLFLILLLILVACCTTTATAVLLQLQMLLSHSNDTTNPTTAAALSTTGTTVNLTCNSAAALSLLLHCWRYNKLYLLLIPVSATVIATYFTAITTTAVAVTAESATVSLQCSATAACTTDPSITSTTV